MRVVTCVVARMNQPLYLTNGVLPFVSSRLFSTLQWNEDDWVHPHATESAKFGGRGGRSNQLQHSVHRCRAGTKRRDEEMRRDDMRERKGWTCITNICLHLLPSSIRCTVTRKQGAMRYVHSQVVCCVRGPGFRRGARRRGQAAGAAGTDNDTATVDTVDTVDTSIAIEEYLPLGTDGGGGPDAGHGLANAMKLPRSSLFFTGERERERERCFPGVRVVLNCIALY